MPQSHYMLLLVAPTEGLAIGRSTTQHRGNSACAPFSIYLRHILGGLLDKYVEAKGSAKLSAKEQVVLL